MLCRMSAVKLNDKTESHCAGAFVQDCHQSKIGMLINTGVADNFMLLRGSWKMPLPKWQAFRT